MLALRSDGRLLDYHGVNEVDSNIRNELLEQQPEELASGGVALYQKGGAVFLLRQDGTLLQWHWPFRELNPTQGLPPTKRMGKVKFPDEWFKEHASPR